MPRYRSNGRIVTAAGCLAVLSVLLMSGCTLSPPAAEEAESSAVPDDAVARHVEFMKRAAEADDAGRARMKRDILRRSGEAALASRLQLGLLLTSPREAGASEGEKLLREILADAEELGPGVRHLIELRLLELETRRALRVELVEARRKIDELLSIESNMESKRNQPRNQSQ